MRRSQSHDASCSPLMEELEGDAYKARASRRLVKNTDFDRGEKVKSDEKKQKRRSGASDDSIHKTTVLYTTTASSKTTGSETTTSSFQKCGTGRYRGAKGQQCSTKRETLTSLHTGM